MKENLVLVAYLTGVKDLQRDIFWKLEQEALMPLANSIVDSKFVVICNQLRPRDIDYCTVAEEITNPYFSRWILYYNYLSKHPEYKMVWIVDATDVIMLRSPWVEMDKNKVYCCYSDADLGKNKVLLNKLVAPEDKETRDCIKTNSNIKTPNSGLLGGTRENVLKFLYLMCSFMAKNKDIIKHDPGPFLYTALTYFKDKIEYDYHVNTKMWTYGKYNPQNAWWAHK